MNHVYIRAERNLSAIELAFFEGSHAQPGAKLGVLRFTQAQWERFEPVITLMMQAAGAVRLKIDFLNTLTKT